MLYKKKPTPITRSFCYYPKEFSEADVKTMLKEYDFYCKEYDCSKEYSNPSGLGFANQFESKIIQGGKVVIDKAAGLIWQQGGSDKYITYEAAKTWIADLNKQGYAGYRDWRLPTLEEAMSLMESKQLNNDLHIDPKFDSQQSYIWTSDLYSSAAAWVVHFYGGYCVHVNFSNNSYVRAVR